MRNVTRVRSPHGSICLGLIGSASGRRMRLRLRVSVRGRVANARRRRQFRMIYFVCKWILVHQLFTTVL